MNQDTRYSDLKKYKKKKPTLNVCLSPVVIDWLRDDAAKYGSSVSAHLNHLLTNFMQGQGV